MPAHIQRGIASPVSIVPKNDALNALCKLISLGAVSVAGLSLVIRSSFFTSFSITF
jgi:hypothetical protein